MPLFVIQMIQMMAILEVDGYVWHSWVGPGQERIDAAMYFKCLVVSRERRQGGKGGLDFKVLFVCEPLVWAACFPFWHENHWLV